MLIRSLKLKLVIPRKGDREAARALWTTHQAINEAAAYYERHLLLMRGDGYLTEDAEVSQGDVRDGLLELVRRAQKETRRGVDCDETEACIVLRRLYEEIVPSAVGKEGSAQAANAFLSPLTDPLSEGQLGATRKAARSEPEWLADAEAGADVTERATAWLESGEAEPWMRDTGSPPGWRRLLQAGDPGWPAAFAKKYRSYEEQSSSGVSNVVQQLKAMGALPLFRPFFKDRLADPGGYLTPWDRLAFRLAVGHLLSWESWSRRVVEEHRSRQEKLAAFRKELARFGSAVEALRQYEAQRQAELVTHGLALPERPYRITRRAVRGWIEVRERWRRLAGRDVVALLAVLREDQTRARERFGDPHLFRWLAKPTQHGLWDHGEVDPVSLLVQMNAAERLVERSRGMARMTLPDARQHPRSVQWEAPGGSNLRNYVIRQAGEAVYAELPLLAAGDRGRLQELVLPFPLAPSRQFREVLLEEIRRGRNSSVHVRYRSNSGRHQGMLGSADLRLDWSFVQRRSAARVETGEIGPAWLSLAIKLEHELPEAEPFPGLADAVLHYRTALGNEKRAAAVRPGLRALAVHLGIRSMSACSVFELRNERPPGKLGVEAGEGLWAVHERSFLLDLPGRGPGSEAEPWRQQAELELRRLRRALARMRRYLVLARAEGDERREALRDLRRSLSFGDPWPFEQVELEALERQVDVPVEDWAGLVKDARGRVRASLAEVVQEWRRRTRSRDTRKKMGKSMWAVEHLTDVRRVLQSWSLAGRASGDIRRLDRNRRGVFASHLLRHLRGIKDDRLKTGADLLVQASRGFVRGKDGGWEQRYRPVHVVLFEDLSRYKMRTDRPRRENSQLMKWAHRSITATVAMQGELYGMQDWRGENRGKYRGAPLTAILLDMSAAFCSRYRAGTMTPGIRCHPMTSEDLANRRFREVLSQENPGLDVDKLRAGDLVPLSSGEVFVCVAGEGLLRIHADINAAQNLQRRFWTRGAEAFRLACRKLERNGGPIYIPLNMGKMLGAAMGGPGYLEPSRDEPEGYRWKQARAAELKRLGAGTAAESQDEVRDDDDLAGLREETLELTGERRVFFRDPSGQVLPPDVWYPAGVFWTMVRDRTVGRV